MSKNLDLDLKIILLDYQNNYVERLSLDNNVANSFNVLHNYFYDPNKTIFRSG